MDHGLTQIRIKNLRLRTYIGFNEEEQVKLQDVVVNVQIDYAGAGAAAHDDVTAALDYKQICKRIIAHVESNRFLLLERLAGDVLGIVKQAGNAVSAKVEVDKPHALRFADSVSITQSWSIHASHVLSNEPEQQRRNGVNA